MACHVEGFGLGDVDRVPILERHLSQPPALEILEVEVGDLDLGIVLGQDRTRTFSARSTNDLNLEAGRGGHRARRHEDLDEAHAPGQRIDAGCADFAQHVDILTSIFKDLDVELRVSEETVGQPGHEQHLDFP